MLSFRLVDLAPKEPCQVSKIESRERERRVCSVGVKARPLVRVAWKALEHS